MAKRAATVSVTFAMLTHPSCSALLSNQKERSRDPTLTTWPAEPPLPVPEVVPEVVPLLFPVPPLVLAPVFGSRLLQAASERDIVRDTGDAIGDIGRSIGNAARDITGTNNYSGTPSWEPDSSAVRY